MLPEVIPGATPKKLFYYAYAQNFCQKIRADKLSENVSLPSIQRGRKKGERRIFGTLGIKVDP